MSTHPALEHDWLGACRAAADGLRAVLADHPTSIERVIETGERGEGGDKTLVIDAEAEDRVFQALQQLHDDGARFTVVSEERGTVDFGGGDILVVVDPIDGSLNAKRGLPHHALSIAVAVGQTMEDVLFGYVYDLGPGEEWRATLGGGAFINDRKITDPPPERRTPDGRLELIAVESADPRWLALASDDLVAATRRIRAMGSIAVSMCQVAATRVDAMASLARTRAVDAAAAQLIVRESGGEVAFLGAPGGPLGAPLDLEPHHPVVAARTPESLQALMALPAVS
ncbi:inositol monophosphatase family protein [Conexibacter woesei]|uniref:inositol monophosphatase family protein n=1 Tax=Conexibacter woesei TaxID=191495 RepID=UPI0018CB8C66|nr:inositol monophosphatase family protein [Conexibacter woesei]